MPTLPRLFDDNPLESADLNFVTETSGPARVIVSDATPAVRADVCDILTSEGFEVTLSTGDPVAAAQSIAGERPELAILGLSSQGFGKAWDIENDDIRNNVMLVALAGEAKDPIAVARAAGASALLSTPISRAELAPAVHIALARFMQQHSDYRDRRAG